MIEKDRVCVLIPTYNEEATIQEVVEGFIDQGFENVLVYDGGSEDDTQSKANESGAEVMEQTGSGKGQAVEEALGIIDEEYVVMIDGDGTYDPYEVETLLEPIERGYDHVIGDRLGNKDAFTNLNYRGNRLFNLLFKWAHGRDLDDILTGYRAFKRETLDHISFTEKGFGIETEMTVEALKRNHRIISVPITYRDRPEDSDTKLRPFRDGLRIGYTIYRMTKTNNPLFYFGSFGVSVLTMGVVIGLYVLYRRYINGVTHELLAVLTALLVLVGVQLLVFAAISDAIIEMHRDYMTQEREGTEKETK